METEKAGTPAYLLMASGILAILYSILYLLWTLVPILISVVGLVGSLIDGADIGGTLGAGVMVLAVPMLQLIGFLVTCVLGALTAFGGVRLNAWRSKGVVVLAILSSVAGPLLAIFINAGSALNVGTCGMGCLTGCLLGNIPTVLLLVFGVVASILATMAVRTPEAAIRFAQDA